MKSVDYTSYDYLECAKCAGEVIICVSPTLTLSGNPYIEGIAASVDCQVNNCGRREYVYGFAYEENQLLDPNTDLAAGNITGVFCKGCLTDYIESIVPTPGNACFVYNEADLVAAEAGACQTIVVAGSVTLTDNRLITKTFHVLRGFTITTTGFTLTINGNFTTGLYQVFAGTGTVIFGNETLEHAYPQWWGSDGDAIQKAINSYRSVFVPKGVYAVNSEISVTQDFQEVTFSCATLNANADNITLIHWSANQGKLVGLVTLDGNTHTGISAIRVTPLNESQIITVVGQDWNTFAEIDIYNCDEGIVLQCGPDVGGIDSGCWYNRFYNIHIHGSKRGIWLKDGPNASSAGCNRNQFYSIRIGNAGSNTGIQIDSGDTNKFFGCAYEGITDGVSPNAVPVAIKIAHNGTHTVSNSFNAFFGNTFENCTTEVDDLSDYSSFVQIDSQTASEHNFRVLGPVRVIKDSNAGLILEDRTVALSNWNLLSDNNVLKFNHGADRIIFDGGGNLGIGVATCYSILQLAIARVPVFASNALAILGGLAAGSVYRTGADPDILAIVH